MADVSVEDLKANFLLFLLYVWVHVLGLPKPTVTQYDIADYLQGKSRRKMVWAFRGVGKSFITAAYVVWRLWRDPHLKVEVLSATGGKASSISTQMMGIIENADILKSLRPDSKTKRWSMDAFDVVPFGLDQSPSVKSVGITGQVTGSRADILVLDDVEIPENSATPAAREKLLNIVGELVNLVLKPNNGSEVVVLGTPQSQETVYRHIERKMNVDLRIWPIEVPSRLEPYRGNLAPMVEKMFAEGKIGQPVDPERFDAGLIASRKASTASAMWTLQMMLDPELTDLDKYPLKLQDLSVFALPSGSKRKAPSLLTHSKAQANRSQLESVGFSNDYWYTPGFIDSEYAPIQKSVLAIDPSGRGKDETAYAVVQLLHSMIFVTRCGGLHGGPTDENLNALARIAQEENVTSVITEQNFGGGMFNQMFRPILLKHHKCLLEEVHHSKQKEMRIIDTLEPLFLAHRLIISPSVIEEDLRSITNKDKGLEYSLFYQATRITRDRGCLKHDDRLDALSMAVSSLLDSLRVDPEKASRDYLKRQSDAWVKKHQKYPSGKKARGKLGMRGRTGDNRLGSSVR